MANNYRLNPAQFGTHRLIGSFLRGKQSILDVGCNDGYLIKIHPQGQYTGLEYSRESAKRAVKNGYRTVKVGDLNHYTRFRLKERFQVIIFADILEHLQYPAKVLSYFVKRNLRRGGRVIISLPNVANFSIRFSLLLGKFNYTNAGILDRTHLHLYTLSSAQKLLAGSGLKIISSHFSSNHFGGLIKIFPFLGPLLGYNLIFLCQKD